MAKGKQRRWYVGPVDEIVTVADGREHVVKRGDSIEVSTAAAERLDKAGTYLETDGKGVEHTRRSGDPIWVDQDPSKSAPPASTSKDDQEGES